MKAKKKKPLTAPRTRAQNKNNKKKIPKKPAPVSQKDKKAALKKNIRGTDKGVQREAPKKAKLPPPKYYITINGKKISLENELIKKYKLRPGDFLPFSRHKVHIEK